MVFTKHDSKKAASIAQAANVVQARLDSLFYQQHKQQQYKNQNHQQQSLSSSQSSPLKYYYNKQQQQQEEHATSYQVGVHNNTTMTILVTMTRTTTRLPV